MERSGGGVTRRRTIHTRRVRVVELRRPSTVLLGWVGGRQGGRVRFIVGSLATVFGAGRTLQTGHTGLLRWRLAVHGLLSVAGGRRRVLAGLTVRVLLRRVLLRWSLLVAVAMLRQRLTVRAVELSVGRRVLSAVDRVGGDESLGLRADGREDALLRETLAVGAAAVFGLIEARAANL